MMLATEVSLSMLMNSLPTGGMMTRIACGSMIRRSDVRWDMPIDFGASVWPRSTDEHAGAHDLGNIGALVEAEAEERGDGRRDDIDSADVEQTRNAETRERRAPG